VAEPSCGAAVDAELTRPAFYALRTGGWRDYVTLLHLPYTAWHLAYVTIGAALAAEFSVARLWPALLAFGLAVGIGAHALDELNGRPLRTQIPDRLLVALAVASIGAAIAIGIVGALTVNAWLALFVAVGGFIVVAYNMESFGGRFHSDVWFALAWGAFPLLTAYFAVAAAAAAFAFASSIAQRVLSTQVREVRRRVASVRGTVERRDGSTQRLRPADLMAVEEAALRALTAAIVALAVALVIMRL
jgi:hypothetical protein